MLLALYFLSSGFVLRHVDKLVYRKTEAIADRRSRKQRRADEIVQNTRQGSLVLITFLNFASQCL